MPDLTPVETAERKRRIKNRNIALGLILVCAAVLFYVVTLVKGVPLISGRM